MSKVMTLNRMMRSYFGISMLDIATCDKIPAIRGLMQGIPEGLALDIGIGTGYTTNAVLGDSPTICLDIHEPNLRYFQNASAAIGNVNGPLCIVADASALPFKPDTFRFILCSEVLEHLSDDETAVHEFARVLANNGRVIITVPHTGLKFASFLELLRLPTVHDFPGPEHHVRQGYDYESLRRLLRVNGLEIENSAYYLRLFTRLMADLVSLVHLIYQRAILGKCAWTWSDATSIQETRAFRVYSLLFPVLSVVCRLDQTIQWMPGFGLIVAVKKQPVSPGPSETG